MIALDHSARQLAPAVRFGLEVLLDISGLARVSEPTVDVVRLAVAAPGSSSSSETMPDALRRGEPHEADGTVTVTPEWLRAVTAVVSAEAEQRSAAADRFGRVPSTENALVAVGMERTPVVDVAAGRLRDAALRAARGRPMKSLPQWPGGHRWAAALTHDLDVVQWWPVFAGMRLLELSRARQRSVFAALRAVVGALGGDPVFDAAVRVLASERRHAVRSTWFVLAGSPTLATFRRGDQTYRPDHPRARAIYDAVRDLDGELGIHGSFATYADAAALTAERRRLSALAPGAPLDGVRQHFLRMRPPRTQHAMVAAGFTYDATFGFPDRNGFRLGTAHVVPAWDAERSSALPLDLVPLAWMDRALSKYRKVHDPAAWIDDAIDLAKVAESSGGLWVGLWHPNLSPALGYPGVEEEYDRLLGVLRSREPFIAPLRELVAWRRRRRRFRIEGVGSEGTLASNDPELCAALQ